MTLCFCGGVRRSQTLGSSGKEQGVLEDCMCSGRARGVDDVMVVIGAVHNILVVFFSWHIVGLHFPPSLE